MKDSLKRFQVEKIREKRSGSGGGRAGLGEVPQPLDRKTFPEADDYVRVWSGDDLLQRPGFAGNEKNPLFGKDFPSPGIQINEGSEPVFGPLSQEWFRSWSGIGYRTANPNFL